MSETTEVQKSPKTSESKSSNADNNSVNNNPSEKKVKTRGERIADAEDRVVNSFGGMDSFMMSYGLKPYDDDDSDEAYAILKALAESDVENGDA